MPLLMWGNGNGDALAIEDDAKISSIYGAVLSFTICTSSLVPNFSEQIFRTPPDFLTGALGTRYGGNLQGCARSRRAYASHARRRYVTKSVMPIISAKNTTSIADA